MTMAKDASFAPDQGFVAEFDIKEDEEQNVKLQQLFRQIFWQQSPFLERGLVVKSLLCSIKP